ncbi:MAG: hypothetical protein SH856_06235 [Flavobacteriales bacterium]|nr:hypothetical protein [Flavobacteriales bacterium]
MLRNIDDVYKLSDLEKKLIEQSRENVRHGSTMTSEEDEKYFEEWLKTDMAYPSLIFDMRINPEDLVELLTNLKK